ncbi:hypothetical protein [Candidatus Albibeggiatoa sp. nov. NOAA]|uniref:hypothetical protein n=1 Tax=Candidatus Albibeggiatoa sp. nov. NOAA TaxID=3162724 RepID=UPI0032FAB7FC|nr:hypothetical protein [Thiotrichaceae bacterium]
MADYTLLFQVKLNPLCHQSTGNAKHFRNGELCSTPHELKIIQYNGNDDFYLFYCGIDGIEFTDAYHDSIESALEQAEWEFNIKPSDWNKITS